MTSEEERPRFITGGYGRHRRQWVNKKAAEVLKGDDLGGKAFVVILRPYPGVFRQLMCPHPGEIAHFLKNKC